MSQWGHDFRPEYLGLSALHERFPDVPRIALTATADTATRAEILTRLDLHAARVFVASFDRPNIRYRISEKTEPRRQLLDFLAEHKGEAGIVYCSTRKKVEETADALKQAGYTALAYHGGMDNDTRRRHQEKFLREDGVVMVATLAFGMGIDKPDVRFVAHMDLPRSVEGYYQETGRAGRDGEPAEAWMAWGLQDVVTQRRFIDENDAEDAHKRSAHGKLDALVGLCEAASCRRVALLSYFGEASQACGNCDVCLNPPTLWDGTEAAQKLLSTVYRTGQRFGAGHVLDVLLGKKTEKVDKFGHDELSVFGIGASQTDKVWRAVLRQLVVRGLLEVDHTAYGALKLTAGRQARVEGRGNRDAARHRSAPHAQEIAPGRQLRRRHPRRRRSAVPLPARLAPRNRQRKGRACLRHPARRHPARDRRAPSRHAGGAGRDIRAGGEEAGSVWRGRAGSRGGRLRKHTAQK